MNLGNICRMAARFADRYDEFVKTVGADGGEVYEGEALNWFQIFRDAVNEAYFEISRTRMTPDVRMACVLPNDRMIDLNGMWPEVCTVCGVYREDGMSDVEFEFATRTEIRVTGARPGETVIVHYQCLPDRLEKESDEPIFPEAQVDPSVYAALAAARLWQSERKQSAAQAWLNEYYRKLRMLRPSMKPQRRRRLPGRLFR